MLRTGAVSRCANFDFARLAYSHDERCKCHRDELQPYLKCTWMQIRCQDDRAFNENNRGHRQLTRTIPLNLCTETDKFPGECVDRMLNEGHDHKASAKPRTLQVEMQASISRRRTALGEGETYQLKLGPDADFDWGSHLAADSCTLARQQHVARSYWHGAAVFRALVA